MIDFSRLSDAKYTEEIYLSGTYPKFEDTYLLILNANPLFCYIYLGLLAIMTFTSFNIKYES
jgi:hypothetical protein